MSDEAQTAHRVPDDIRAAWVQIRLCDDVAVLLRHRRFDRALQLLRKHIESEDATVIVQTTSLLGN